MGIPSSLGGESGLWDNRRRGTDSDESDRHHDDARKIHSAQLLRAKTRSFG
jgi:hypothetical protein